MLPCLKFAYIALIVISSILAILVWFPWESVSEARRWDEAPRLRFGVPEFPDDVDDDPDSDFVTPKPPLAPDSVNSRIPEPGATHTYLPNGLLELNPNATHPILELIQRAEARWQEKVNRASRTLEQAVAEYKRRYQRPPPAGFDDWWAYAQANDVQLPDEYDLIYEDLEPFWGMSPQDLIKIQLDQERVTDTFTIAKNASWTHTDLAHTAFSAPNEWRERKLLRGVDEVLSVLDPVEKLLPPFRATFSPHDNPMLLSDFHIKEALLQAAREGKYVDLDALPEPKHIGFAAACPPGSPGRMSETHINQTNRPGPSPVKKFIYDHEAALDPCYNPSIFYNHGQYITNHSGPDPQPRLVMQFAYCSTPLYHDLQPPTWYAWIEDVDNDTPWENKTDERLFWRGSNTGASYSNLSRWQHTQRIHLVEKMAEINGTEKVLLPLLSGDGDGRKEWDNTRVGLGVDVKKIFLNPALMDIAFTGGPLECEPEYCAYMETLFEWRRMLASNSTEIANHKYFLDVDGNGWSSRFKRLMTSNSLVFKATAYREWWIDRVEPWVHYVPIQVGYSDLYDAYIFFRGGAYGEGNHDDLARNIASAGREWSLKFWRREDMTAYFFRLLLEYVRLMSPDRDTLVYDPAEGSSNVECRRGSEVTESPIDFWLRSGQLDARFLGFALTAYSSNWHYVNGPSMGLDSSLRLCPLSARLVTYSNQTVRTEHGLTQ